MRFDNTVKFILEGVKSSVTSISMALIMSLSANAKSQYFNKPNEGNISSKMYSQLDNKAIDKKIILDLIKVSPKELQKYSKDSIPLLVGTALRCGIIDSNQIAYILATVEHEAKFGLWMHELSSGKKYEGRKDLNNVNIGDGIKYKGRGYVQLTGRVNYSNWDKTFSKFDLNIENDPEKVVDPVVAAEITVRGMRDGTFRGKKLSDYINKSKVNFYAARNIINGDVKKNGKLIEGYAKKYANILNNYKNYFENF